MTAPARTARPGRADPREGGSHGPLATVTVSAPSTAATHTQANQMPTIRTCQSRAPWVARRCTRSTMPSPRNTVISRWKTLPAASTHTAEE